MRIVGSMPDNLFGRNPLYDWSLILDGQCRELIRGEDFHCTTSSWVQMAYRQSRKLNKKAHIKVAGESVFIQAEELK